MSGALPVVLALLLGMAPAALDLQVEARTAEGAAAPRLADAISRALAALGARVVIGPGEPCGRCVLLTVVEERSGRYRLEARRRALCSTAMLELSSTAPELERARALAIQARMLVVDWPEPAEEPAPAPVVASVPRPGRKGRDGVAAAAASPEPSAPVVTTPAPVAEPPAEPLEIAPSPALADPPAAAPAALLEEADAPEPTPVEVRRTPLASRSPEASARAEAIERGRGPLPWVAWAGGVGAGIGGGACAMLASSHYQALVDRSQSLAEARSHRDAGKRLQTASLVLSGIAIGGLVAGTMLWLRDPGERPVALGAGPLEGGGWVGVSGSLP